MIILLIFCSLSEYIYTSADLIFQSSLNEYPTEKRAYLILFCPGKHLPVIIELTIVGSIK